MGLDLVDFFRGRHSWRKLRLILDRLPTSSAYREAVLDDPEVAEFLARQPETDHGPAAPRLSEYDVERALLTDIYDRLGAVIEAIVASNGGKPPRIHPSPRPITGVAKARRRLEMAQYQSLKAEFEEAQIRWAASRQEKESSS